MLMCRITEDFLLKGMLEGKDISDEEDYSGDVQSMIDGLKENLEWLDDDEEIKDKIDRLEELLRINEGKIDYVTYTTDYYGITGVDYDSLVEEEHKKYEEVEDYIYHSRILIENFLRVIKNLPQNIEVTVDFSSKSNSVYIMTNIPASIKNRRNFIIPEIYFDVTDVYEDYDEDDNEKINIEIRLSDHDFKGFHSQHGMCEYHSYKKECINYVYLIQ